MIGSHLAPDAPPRILWPFRRLDHPSAAFLMAVMGPSYGSQHVPGHRVHRTGPGPVGNRYHWQEADTQSVGWVDFLHCISEAGSLRTPQNPGKGSPEDQTQPVLEAQSVAAEMLRQSSQLVAFCSTSQNPSTPLVEVGSWNHWDAATAWPLDCSNTTAWAGSGLETRQSRWPLLHNNQRTMTCSFWLARGHLAVPLSWCIQMYLVKHIRSYHHINVCTHICIYIYIHIVHQGFSQCRKGKEKKAIGQRQKTSAGDLIWSSPAMAASRGKLGSPAALATSQRQGNMIRFILAADVRRGFYTAWAKAKDHKEGSGILKVRNCGNITGESHTTHDLDSPRCASMTPSKARLKRSWPGDHQRGMWIKHEENPGNYLLNTVAAKWMCIIVHPKYIKISYHTKPYHSVTGFEWFWRLPVWTETSDWNQRGTGS